MGMKKVCQEKTREKLSGNKVPGWTRLEPVWWRFK